MHRLFSPFLHVLILKFCLRIIILFRESVNCFHCVLLYPSERVDLRLVNAPGFMSSSTTLHADTAIARCDGDMRTSPLQQANNKKSAHL